MRGVLSSCRLDFLRSRVRCHASIPDTIQSALQEEIAISFAGFSSFSGQA
nr:MAG TPA: hypothetical protein [Caudoviricetes sp.]